MMTDKLKIQIQNYLQISFFQCTNVSETILFLFENKCKIEDKIDEKH